MTSLDYDQIVTQLVFPFDHDQIVVHKDLAWLRPSYATTSPDHNHKSQFCNNHSRPRSQPNSGSVTTSLDHGQMVFPLDHDQIVVYNDLVWLRPNIYAITSLDHNNHKSQCCNNHSRPRPQPNSGSVTITTKYYFRNYHDQIVFPLLSRPNSISVTITTK